MLHRMDWDRYWHFERFRRQANPLDFRKWKRDSQRELRALYPGEQRLLDSTAGLGDHTVNLAEEGFTVESMDESEIALGATRDAVKEAGLDVDVFRGHWRDVGRTGYDLVFNDALHWTYEEDVLATELAGLYRALRPGGTLVFFFADRAHPEAGYGRSILEWDWKQTEPERVAWDHRVDDLRVTLSVLAERGEDYIDEHHVFLEQKGRERPEVESLTVRRVYRWDWHGLTPLLERAGFVDPRSDHFENVKGYGYALSRADRPA